MSDIVSRIVGVQIGAVGDERKLFFLGVSQYILGRAQYKRSDYIVPLGRYALEPVGRCASGQVEYDRFKIIRRGVSRSYFVCPDLVCRFVQLGISQLACGFLEPLPRLL